MIYYFELQPIPCSRLRQIRNTWERRSVFSASCIRGDSPSIFIPICIVSCLVVEYGLLCNRHRAEHLARCRELLAMLPPIPQPNRNYRERCQQLTGRDPFQCPQCNRGTMVRIATLPIVRLVAISNTS
jgi:hypothetical protein